MSFSTRFPKHKELFADDYYSPSEPNEEQTPFDHNY